MKISDKGLAWDLAEYICGLDFENIPQEVIAKTKAVLLHHLGVALGGVSSTQARIAMKLVKPQADGVAVIGHAMRAAPRDAVFANSIVMRSLRMEDCLAPSYAHPGPTSISVALAIGEAEHVSGREFITSLIASYDVLSRLAGATDTVELVLRASHYVFGPIAASVAAARLMRLDVNQTACTLAYAGSLGSMTYSGFQDFHVGLICRNAIQSAELGKVGAPYGFDALEGPHGFYVMQVAGIRPSDDELLGELGVRFDILNDILKPHPCTGVNLAALTLLRRAMREHGLTSEAIRRIKVTRSKTLAAHPHANRKPPFDAALGGPAEGAFERGMYVAAVSLPYSIANVLLGADITLQTFEVPDEARHLVPQMDKVEIGFRAFSDEFWHELEIETTDGRTLHYAGGKDDLVAPDAQTILNRYAVPVIGTEKVARLQAAVRDLERAPDLSELTSCLTGTS